MNESRGQDVSVGRSPARECYRVSDLTIDVGAMRVWQGPREIRLPPLSFELLLLFVRRAPDVVSRDECFRTVWRGVVVGPETLKQRVKLLRESLSDSSREPRYIETVRGRGYRLLPNVKFQETDSDDWPSRLRSRLRELLGPGGGHRSLGTLAVAGLLLIVALAFYRNDGQALAAAETAVRYDERPAVTVAVPECNQRPLQYASLPPVHQPDCG